MNPVDETESVDRFWEVRKLHEMSASEWESLCDGCARCCLHKLQDPDTEEVAYTRVVCRYLDENKCRCTEYQDRHELVPECVWLTPDDAYHFNWLPRSCAYRTLAEGRPLAEWHPLVSGDPDSVFTAGIAVRGKVVNESFVHPDGLEEHIIHWVELEPTITGHDDE